jgi:hypothetical protein
VIAPNAMNLNGIFGKVNNSTTFADIVDGTTNTIMLGELQRVGPMSTPQITPPNYDGWAIGGLPTLFGTGFMMQRSGTGQGISDTTVGGTMLNNYFAGSPGSEHSGGAHFGLADASVRWIMDSVDPNVFALLGSMADKQPIPVNLIQ